MASAQSLIGLVTRLHSFESTLVNILMENVLRIASLAELNVFFLVEKTDGRWFAGNDRLCQAYNVGALRNSGCDLELECDTFSTALKRKTLVPPSPQLHPRHTLPPSAPQLHPPHPGPPSTPHLRSPPRPIPENPNNVSSILGKRSSSSPLPSSPAKELKMLPLASNCSVEDPILIDDDDDFVVEDYGDGGDGDGGGSEAIKTEIPNFEASNDATLFADASNGDDSSHNADDLNVSWILQDFLPRSKKFHFLQGVADASELARNTVTRKVLDSVLYELGKEAAARYPFHGRQSQDYYAKIYINEVCLRWCRELKNFELLENCKIEQSDTKQHPFKVYVRKVVRSRFNSFSGSNRRRKTL